MTKLASLQIMRGVAAMLVVICHSIAVSHEWAIYPEVVVDFARHIGKIGVYLFFVISGFIIVHTSIDKFGAEGSARDFLGRRLIRVVPLYWMATGVEILLRGVKHTTPTLSSVVHSMFFIPQAVEPGSGGQMMPVFFLGWTLNYEMMFYVIFAVCLLLPRRGGLLALAVTMIAIVAIGAIFRPLSDTSSPTTLFAFWSDPTILLFLLGVLIGVGFDWTAGARVRVPFGLISALGAVAALLLLIAVAGVDYPLTSGWRAIVWTLCGLSVALAVFDAGNLQSRWVAAAAKLGDASYSIYLFHFFFVVAFSKLWTMVFGHVLGLGFIAAAIVVGTAAGLAIHRRVERPLTDALRSRRWMSWLHRLQVPEWAGGPLGFNAGSSLLASALKDRVQSANRGSGS